MNDYLNTKLKIYESFDNNYITESEKDDLLLLLEETDDDENKEKKKKLAKTIGLIIAFITFILSLPILYIAIKDVHRKAKFGKRDVEDLKKYRSKLKSLEDDIYKVDSNIDDISKEAESIYRNVRIIGTAILTYDGTPIQKAKGKKLVDEINKHMSFITGNAHTRKDLDYDF